MTDEDKAKGQLITELVELRQRVAELEALLKQRQHSEALSDIVQTVNQPLKLEELLSSTISKTVKAMHADMGMVYMLDMKEKALVMRVYLGMSEQVARRIAKVKYSDQELRKVPRWKIPSMSFSELFGEATLTSIATEMREERVQSIAAIPFSGKGRLNGVIIIASRSQHKFGQDDMKLLGDIGRQIGIGIENTMLFQEVRKLTITDSQTGLYNHRHFQQRIEDEIARSSRYRLEFSIIMLSVDDFKSYAASCGQTSGNEIIEMLAMAIPDCLRNVDAACRFNADKFGIILPYTGCDGAQIVAERLRRKAKDIFALTSRYSHFKLTISLGIASFPHDAVTYDKLIELAQGALASAIRQRGNQTCLVSDIPDYVSVVNNEVSDFIKNVRESGVNSVFAMAAAVDANNKSEHSWKVARYAVAIGEALSLPNRKIRELRTAALLHDIGKAAIPHDKVQELACLNTEEQRILREHPEIGATIVSQIPELDYCTLAIKHHHEWYDGSGYPGGLREKDIPVESRIIAIADAYDNMIAPHSHRQVMTPQEAVDELMRRAGTQFDPAFVMAFVNTITSGVKV